MTAGADMQSSSQIITTTNQYLAFYRPDAVPVANQTVSKQLRESGELNSCSKNISSTLCKVCLL